MDVFAARAPDRDGATSRRVRVVVGTGYVGGRVVAAFSQDFTVVGGSLGKMHAKKIVALMQQAAKLGLPLVAFKIVAAIHWQALRLWLKGARLTPRPDAAAASPVNIILATGEPRDYTGPALPAAGSRESALVQ